MKTHLHLLGHLQASPICIREQGVASRSGFAVDDCVFVLITAGAGLLRDELSGAEIELRPGVLIHRSPGRRFTQSADADCRQIYLQAPLALHGFLAAAWGDVPASQTVDPLVVRRQWLLFAAKSRNSSYAECLLALPRLLGPLAAGGGRQSWLEEARHLLAVERLPPPECATRMKLGYASFRARFREQQGEAPAAFQRRMIIQHAGELLAQTDLPVGAVAQAAGFADIYSFSRMFRRETGLPPSAWRQTYGNPAG